MKMKYEKGRETYRLSEEDPFVGNPLVEIHDELLDLLNYCREARSRRMVLAKQLKPWESDIRKMVTAVRRWIKDWEAQ
jgi:hypothetical protein